MPAERLTDIQEGLNIEDIYFIKRFIFNYTMVFRFIYFYLFLKLIYGSQKYHTQFPISQKKLELIQRNFQVLGFQALSGVRSCNMLCHFRQLSVFPYDPESLPSPYFLCLYIILQKYFYPRPVLPTAPFYVSEQI